MKTGPILVESLKYARAISIHQNLRSKNSQETVTTEMIKGLWCYLRGRDGYLNRGAEGQCCLVSFSWRRSASGVLRGTPTLLTTISSHFCKPCIKSSRFWNFPMQDAVSQSLLSLASRWLFVIHMTLIQRVTGQFARTSSRPKLRHWTLELLHRPQFIFMSPVS